MKAGLRVLPDGAGSMNQSTLDDYSSSGDRRGNGQFTTQYTKRELLKQLELFKEKYGEIEYATLRDDPDFATPHTFRRNFGSLPTAEVAAGLADYDVCHDCGLNYKHLSSHWRRSDCTVPELTGRQKEIITGLLMGDASACFGQTEGTVVVKMAMVTRPFIEWTNLELQPFGLGVYEGYSAEQSLERARRHNNPVISENPSYRDLYRVQTMELDIFSEWREWYGDGGKRYPESLELTPLITKCWYCCDGSMNTSRGRSRAVPEISCKNESDRPEFLKSLFRDVGFEVSVHNGNIRLSQKCVEGFLDWLGDPMPGFEYKFARSREEYMRLSPYR